MKTFRKAVSFTALLLAVITLVTLAGSAFAAGSNGSAVIAPSVVSSQETHSDISFRDRGYSGFSAQDSGFTVTASGRRATAPAASGEDGSRLLASGPNGTVTLNEDAGVSGEDVRSSVLLQVFVNLVNSSMSDQIPEGMEGLEDPTLADYPLDPHELEDYGDSIRVRMLTEDPEEENPNYLVYRESILLIPQGDHDGVKAEFSSDRRTAVLKGISGVLSPEDLEGKTGLVLLEENAFLDQIFIFDGQPAWESGALRLRLADAETLKLNHLFSDGRFGISGRTNEKEGQTYLRGENGELIPLNAIPKAAEGAPGAGIPAVGRETGLPASVPESGRLGGAPMLASSAPGALLRDGLPMRAESNDAGNGLGAVGVSGTNWSGTVTYNPSDFGIDLDFDANIFKLKFEVSLSVTGAAHFDITSTGSSGGRESADVVTLTIQLGYGFFVDMQYKFVAQFDWHPVHVAGDMRTKMVTYMSAFEGTGIRSFTTDVTYDAVDIREADKNLDVQFYIGNSFEFGFGWLQLDINLLVARVKIGPVFRIYVKSEAGTNSVARLNKDQFNSAHLNRSAASVHSCTDQGKAGCISLRSTDLQNYSLRLHVDLFFKEWDISLLSDGEQAVGTHEHHKSLSYGDIWFISGVCPHIYYNIPVRVVNRLLKPEPVPNANVQALRKDLIDSNIRELLGTDIADENGKANVFMPYAENTHYSIGADITIDGHSFSGYDTQLNPITAGMNDEVTIVLESDEKKTLNTVQTWDIDLQGLDRPAAMQIAILELMPVDRSWHVHEYHDGDRISMSVATLDPTNLWSYFTAYPLYAIDGSTTREIQYRAVQLNRLSKYTVDSDLSGRDEMELARIRANIESLIVKEPYAFYDVPAYIALNEQAVPDHQTKYQIATNVIEEGNSFVFTEFTNTAVYDVNLFKRWVDVPEAERPAYVYLTLLGRPADGWMERLTESQAVGLHPVEMPVSLPLSGSPLSLQDLKDANDLKGSLPRVLDEPLAIMKVNAAGGWKTSFMIKKYDRGVPRVYWAAELSTEIIRSMLENKFGTSQQVTLKAPGTGLYVSIPGNAIPVFHDWELTGTAINVGANQEDQQHIIGGVKYWEMDGYLPASIVVNVEELSAPEGRSGLESWTVPVTYPGNGEKAWVWTLKDDRIDAEHPENYRVSEQLPETTPGGAKYYEHRVEGFDLINKWVGQKVDVKIRIVWDFDDTLPADVRWPDEIVRFKAKPGYLVPDRLSGKYTLTRDYGSYTYRIRDVAVGSLDEIQNLQLEIVSCDPFFDHIDFILDPVLTESSDSEWAGVPEYTFTIIHRIQYDYSIFAKKEFATSGWEPEYGWPKTVILGLNRDHERLETYELDFSEDPWHGNPYAFTTDVPHLSPEGKAYLYEVVEETPGYDMLPDPTHSRDTGFIPEMHVGESYYHYSYPTESLPEKEYRITREQNFFLTNRWVDHGVGYATVDINIHWEDEAYSGARPDQVKISVIRVIKGTQDYEVVRTLNVTPDESGNWTWMTSGLPETVWITYSLTHSELKEYEYFVMEEHIPGYATFYATEKKVNPKGGSRWVCDVTNKLYGYVPFSVEKVLEGNQIPDELKNLDYTFKVEAAHEAEVDGVSWIFPEPLKETVTIHGVGTAFAEFFFDEDGIYLYRITETANPERTDLLYDTVPKYLVFSVSIKEDGMKEINAHLITAPGVQAALGNLTADGAWSGTGAASGSVSGTGSDGSTPGGSASGTPGSILEQPSSSAQPMRANKVTFTNRVRDYLTIRKEWQADALGLDLPANVRVRIQRLQTPASGDQTEVWEWVLDENNQPLEITLTAEKGWVETLVLDEGTYRVREMNPDPEHPGDPLEAGGLASYTIRESDDITHLTDFRVSYAEPVIAENRQLLTIRNMAVRTVRVHKSWIGFDEDEMVPVYLALLGRPEIPGEAAPDLDPGSLVLNPLTGGLDDAGLRAMLIELGVGVDAGLLPPFSTTAAIGRVSKENLWTVAFEVPKYDEHGNLMLYWGAEIDQALLRQMLRRVYGVDLPVEYDDGLDAVAVPGRAYDALADWTLQSMLLQDLVKAGGTLTQVDLDTLHIRIAEALGTPSQASPIAPVINVKVTPPEKLNRIFGTVTWIGDRASNRPESLDVHIYADGQEIKGSPVTVYPASADPNRPDIWVWYFDLGDDVAPGAELTVSEEFPLDYDYEARYLCIQDGLDIVNIWQKDNDLGDVIFRIEKEWEIPLGLEGTPGAAGSLVPGQTIPVKVGFFDSSTDEKITELTLSADNGWAVELRDEADGVFLHGLQPGDYYIRELNMPDNVQASYPVPRVTVRRRIDGTEAVTDRIITYTVSNWVSDPDRTSVTGRKTWLDEENKDETRPESVLVQLYRGGEPYFAPGGIPHVVTVSAAGGWEYHFPDLPRTEAEGNPIHWSVREVQKVGDVYQSPPSFPARGGITKTYVPSYAVPVYDAASGLTVCGITNILKDPGNPQKHVTVVKKWDIDLEGKDHPDSIEVAVQRYVIPTNVWITEQRVTLSNSNDWKVDLTLPWGLNDGRLPIYRFRELSDGFLARLEDLAEEYAGNARDKFDEWRPKLVEAAGTNLEKLPESIRTALNTSFDALKIALNVGEDMVLSKLIKQLREATGEERIVHADFDLDRPSTEEGTPSVEYYVRSYQSVLTGETVQAHRTKYHVGYENIIEKILDESDLYTYTITNKAILEISVTKRWINLGEDSEQPDSAWIVLEFHPAEGALEKAGDMAKAAGVDISKLMDFDLPCFSVLENNLLNCGLIDGGINPVNLISQLIIGIDLDIFKLADPLLTVAVAKVDEDDDWTANFVHTKYMFGVPVEYKGAELGSEILRQIVKYILKVDIPISYNPFENYISIPGKAYGNLLSQFTPENMFDMDDSIFGKLTRAALADVTKKLNEIIQQIIPGGLPIAINDWQLAANVINIEINPDWDIDPDDDTIRGTKVWRNDTEEDRPEFITIELMEDEEVIDSVTLQKADHKGESVWDWEIVPEGYEADGDYTVREVWPEGFNHSHYTTTISGYDIYNTKDLVTVAGHKTWIDADNKERKRPSTLRIYLLRKLEDEQEWHRVQIQVKNPEDGTTTMQDLYVETSAVSGWTWVFQDLPKNDGANPPHTYVYTVEEDPVPADYTAKVDGYNITNTLIRNDLQGKKIWVDNNNQDGIRPNSVQISILADGNPNPVKTLTVSPPQSASTANEWPFTVGPVPKYNPDGSEIVYTAREDTALNDYITTQSGLVITNVHAPEKIRIIVNKVWQDADDQDGVRPRSVTVRLYAKAGENGQEFFVKEGTISQSSGWSYDFGLLDVYREGVRLFYRVVEEDLSAAGYSVEYRSVALLAGMVEEDPELLTQYIEITNTRIPEKTEVTGEKRWIDENNAWQNRPDSIRVRLWRNGIEIDSKTVYARDGWVFRFTGLDKYENHGSPVNYTVTEDVPEPYTAEITREGNHFIITNSLRKLTVTGKKIWNDANNQDGKRPESVTLRLGAAVDGAPVENLDGQTRTISEHDQWVYAFRDLPRYVGGREVDYTVTETLAPSGYDSSSIPAGGIPDWNEDHTRGTVDFENRHVPELTSVYGWKTWDDDDDRDRLRPESLTVYLMKNGKEIDSRVITAANNWSYRFTGLPKYENGKIIQYTVTEETIPYISEAYHWDLINHHAPEKIDIRVIKYWDDARNQDGIRPTEVTVALRAGGGLVGACTLSEENGWTWTFRDLPAREAGRTILFRAVEAVPTGYEPEYLPETYEYDEAAHKWIWTWKIINHHTPESTEISGRKIWEDEDDMDRLRPDTIRILLYSQFGQEDMEITSAELNWEYHFINLPKNRNGVRLEYYVKEEPIRGYAGETIGYDLINKIVGLPYTVEFYYQKDGVYPETPDQSEERLARIGTEVSVTEEDLRRATGRYSLDESAPNIFEGVIPRDGTLRLKLYFRPYYIITYDPNGGLVEGSTEPISFNHYYGDEISIHDAAVRDNYLFVCWRGSEYQPGDAYTVTEDHTFTAQWRYDNPLSYRFTFTKKWVGGTGDSLSWTLYDPDGRPVTKKFDKTAVSDTEWVYTAWFGDGREYYLVENVPEGFSVRYENTGAHAGETNRVYNGGTIINYRIPKTGEGFPWGPVLAATGLLGLIGLALIAARRKR